MGSRRHLRHATDSSRGVCFNADMKPVRRERGAHCAHSAHLRSCGIGTVLAGLLFVVWGYVDRPHLPPYLGVVVNFLSCVVPALFLAGVVGLSVLCGRRVGALGWMGLVLVSCGSIWGVVHGIAYVDPLYLYLVDKRVSTYPVHWLTPTLTGLTLVGLAIVRTRTLRGFGALLLATGAFGWVYYFTDSGAVLEARPVHIGFGLLFSLCWVALGLALWREGVRQA
jgi:hypothetical protein